MNLLLRVLCTVLLACAALAGPHPAGRAASPERAAAPAVAYTNVVREPCSTYTSDGEVQRQCQAGFTVAARGLRPGYRVVVRSLDHGMVRVLGRFTAAGPSASKRFRDVVVSYGPPDDVTRVSFRVVVKNAEGVRVLATRPRTF